MQITFNPLKLYKMNYGKPNTIYLQIIWYFLGIQKIERDRLQSLLSLSPSSNQFQQPDNNANTVTGQGLLRIANFVAEVALNCESVDMTMS